MPDSIRQILAETRRLLSYLKEGGLTELPTSPGLIKFLAGGEENKAPQRPSRPPARTARPAATATSSRSRQSEQQVTATPLPELEQELAGCRLCSLHREGELVASGRGPEHAPLFLIEDRPGAEEEAPAAPFSGEAGELLDRMLQAIGLRRDQVYLTSLVKCRPPENREPTAAEIDACGNFLARQIAAVKPAIICAMGQRAAQFLTGSNLPLFRMRGRFYDFHGTPLLVSFHPRFLLGNPELKKTSWQDLQTLQKQLPPAAP